MPPTLSISNRTIGPGEPVFIIAEIGVNHDGSTERALELVEHARQAGADAVKLQIFRADQLMHASGEFAKYQKATGDQNDATPAAMLRRYELSPEECDTIAAAITAAGMLPLATPFSPSDVAEIDRLNLPAVKIASPDAVNWLLLKKLANENRPMLVSVGACQMPEVERTVKWLQDWNTPFALLHCISAYPVPGDQAHLSWITELGRKFNVPIGYSDHTNHELSGALAVAAGACIIEKHLTWHRAAPGPDHAASADPQQFARYAANIRQAERLLGKGEKHVLKIEEDVRRVSRQSLVLRQTRPAGHVLTEDDLTTQRPGTGISPADIAKVIGRKLLSNQKTGVMLDWSHVVLPSGG